MTVVGLQSTVLPTFVIALALVCAYSGLFAWINRYRLPFALLATVGWSLAAFLVLVVTSTDPGRYWAVALLVLAAVTGVGTAFSALRHDRKVRVRAGSLTGP